MSLTVVEHIAEELQTRLRALLSRSSSYNTKVREVLRPARLGTWTPQHLQIVLTKGADEVVDELSYPGNPPAVARRVTFNIRCHVMNDENSTDAIDTVCDTFAADIQLAVVGSNTSWHTFGGYSVDAQFLAPEPINAEGGLDGVDVPIAITYRHSEGNPYEVRG